MSHGHDLAQTVAALDMCADEAALRAEITRAMAGLTRRPEASQAWSAVLRRAVAAAVRVVEPADWTWFVSGSVARGEAVPGSDVETMVMLGEGVGDPEKADLLARAAQVHALLERSGIGGDANGVLASRSRFCRRRSSWDEGIERWATEPERDRGVVMTGLVADASALAGAEDAMRVGGAAAAGRHYAVRQAMLQDATAVRASVPSRLRVFVSAGDAVDVKRAVLDPVVKIARWASLSVGSTELTTRQRLADGAAGGVLDSDDAETLRECQQWLMRFRWQARVADLRTGRTVGDVVALRELSPQDRAALRSVAREVSGVMRKLGYLASVSAFADQ
ncbi:putative nucleotidyltransferase substrate binding domain-containing protein [Mycobacterium sp. PSTR-4-N]|uniref:putative nucleotidyltransferase substrate binding domain-containing protein n=1 Tax=Mycobacterium sp. PSTR-4-N TaxID=2917745 RepID=UPI001F153250|nr:putative nucleotidyltransferase substrate binding domain-containing protein [Mycobacterium sp. PSTR-4-N]MCG7594600.1 DUF294 nucleotidyltransferase-like domain-containing protein [Mycobacterium sp. PSTR-4-N]